MSMTRSAWRAKLQAVHPDHGGSVEEARAVIAEYREWCRTHRVCAYRLCRKEFIVTARGGDKAQQRFCSQHCVKLHRSGRYLRVTAPREA